MQYIKLWEKPSQEELLIYKTLLLSRIHLWTAQALE